jgi:hypothetical protein
VPTSVLNRIVSVNMRATALRSTRVAATSGPRHQSVSNQSARNIWMTVSTSAITVLKICREPNPTSARTQLVSFVPRLTISPGRMRS